MTKLPPPAKQSHHTAGKTKPKATAVGAVPLLDLQLARLARLYERPGLDGR
jgi:hypothetical protein